MQNHFGRNFNMSTHGICLFQFVVYLLIWTTKEARNNFIIGFKRIIYFSYKPFSKISYTQSTNFRLHTTTWNTKRIISIYEQYLKSQPPVYICLYIYIYTFIYIYVQLKWIHFVRYMSVQSITISRKTSK